MSRAFKHQREPEKVWAVRIEDPLIDIGDIRGMPHAHGIMKISHSTMINHKILREDLQHALKEDMKKCGDSYISEFWNSSAVWIKLMSARANNYMVYDHYHQDSEYQISVRKKFGKFEPRRKRGSIKVEVDPDPVDVWD